MRPQIHRIVPLLLTLGYRHSSVPHLPRILNGKVSQPADAADGNCVPLRHVAFANRIECRDTGA